MKFKTRTLDESFGYSQWALNKSKDIAESLADFLFDSSNIEHRDEFLSLEDEYKLQEARNILERFYSEYRTFAYRKASEYYDNKGDNTL
jgi:hypothetical protein